MIRAVCSFLAITLFLSNELRVSSGLELDLVDGSNDSQFSNDRQLDITKFNKLNARRSDINVGNVSNLQQDGAKAVEIIEEIAELIIDNKDEIKDLIIDIIDKKYGNDGKNPDKKPSKGGDKPSKGGDKPSKGGDKPSKGGDKPSKGGDKPSKGGDKPSKGGDKPSKGGDKPSKGGDKSSKGGDKKKPPKGGDNKKEPKGGSEKKKEPSKGPKSPKRNVKGPYIRSKPKALF
eukprot:CAMPEP_0194447296 /NCGR_PEP_ID=MMETSP0176-20130528/128931_1 /TAXON_ID=216777 /ORGANISM="Proboscia alata, Strain PI-D3" /LENGTH=231 /DNA_ID=CAMNT_0039274141 /DNA_START=72 /DNA_END=767 /DNA_ORIENTATION=-